MIFFGSHMDANLMSAEPLSTDGMLAQLRWRYAVKRFDPTRKIAAATWSALEEALVLSPSSWGLQPWKFVVVTDPAMREKLLPVSWNQRQVVDASHLVVLCIRKNLGLADIDRFVRRTAEVRGVAVESLAKFQHVLVKDIVDGPRSLFTNQWAANQVHIALGNFLTAAAMVGVDTCPMEGFEPAKYDQLLGLSAKGLASIVVCAAGYRGADDKYATLPKVRFAVEEVIERL